jgi:two-component sensor histidine kinase
MSPCACAICSLVHRRRVGNGLALELWANPLPREGPDRMTGVIDPRRLSLKSEFESELPPLEKRDYLDWLADVSQRIKPLSAQAIGIGIACLAAAAALRVAMGWSQSDLRYAIFLPAILAADLLAGLPIALGVMIASIVFVVWAYMPPYFAFKWPASPEQATALWSLFAGLCTLLFAQGCRTVLQRMRAHQVTNDILLRELAHRGRNIFAVVEVILQKTLAGDREQADALIGRLRAISYANELLISRRDEPINIMTLLLQEFAPYGEGQLLADGPRVDIEPEAARHLVLLFHELVTNAAKYGALSSPTGRVTVDWMWKDQDLVLNWKESGGPTVAPPLRRGFGSELITACAKTLSGTVQSQFPPDGFACLMAFPLTR